MIQDPENGFDMNKHYFLTPHQRVYDAIASCGKVALIKNDFSDINDYLAKCDWAFFHCIPRPHIAMRIKREYRQKVIWRTWGHDALGYRAYDGIKSVGKRIWYHLWKNDVRHYRAIGIGNVVDEWDIRTRFGSKTPVFELAYSVDQDRKQMIEAIKSEPPIQKNTVNVLIGHSCHIEENHIKILDILNRFQAEKIQIFIICSYGNAEYIEEVKKYANDHWAEKVTIVSDFMPIEQFARFIKNMDIAILDSKRSYALGTLAYLLEFHKKVYLNKDGVLHKVLEDEKIPHDVINHIASQEFSEFSDIPQYTDACIEKLAVKPVSEYLGEWKRLFGELEREISVE